MQELFSENLFYDGHCFWFTEWGRNALFRMDRESWKPELAGIFPGEKTGQENLYSAMTLCRRKLYFAPFTGEEIGEYDPVAGAFRKISLAVPRVENGRPWEQAKFFNVVSQGNKLYFLPYFYPGILVYDTDTDKINCIDDWVEEIERLHTGERGYFREAELAGGELVLPCICADAVVILDLDAERTRIIRTPPASSVCRYCGVFFAGGCYYLLSADGTIAKRKLASEEETVKKIQIPVSGQDEIAFYPVQRVGCLIYLFPSKNSKGYVLDTRTDDVTPTELFEEEKAFEGEKPLYASCCWDGEKLYAFTGNSRRFLAFDLGQGGKREGRLYVSEQDRTVLETAHREEAAALLCDTIVVENGEEALADLLETLWYCREELENREESRGVGRTIYETVILDGDR